MRFPLLRTLKRLVLLAAGATVLWLTLLSLPLTGRALFNYLQIYPPLRPQTLPELLPGPPAAIVILAAERRGFAPEFGGAFRTATVGALTLERVRYGAFLAHNTGLPVLVSGGSVPVGTIEMAPLMAETLRTDFGIQAQWQERISYNTAENAIHSVEMLKRDGIERVFLVTHAWHMKRARASFEANGITVIPAPTAFYRPQGSLQFLLTPSANGLRMSQLAMHEIIGSVWYRFRYGYR